MTQKTMVTIITVAAVIAAGIIGWSMTHPPAAPAQPAVAPAKPAAVKAFPPVQKKPVATAKEPVVESVAPEAPKVDLAAQMANDPESFLKNLTADQRKELRYLLMKKFGSLGGPSDPQRFQLPMDRELTAWDSAFMKAAHPDMVPNEAQKMLIQNVKATFRPKMEAAMANIIAKDDEYTRQYADIMYNAKLPTEEYWNWRELHDEKARNLAKINDIKESFAQDYENSVRQFLTPAQIKSLDDLNKLKADRLKEMYGNK
jgi:hypothetical protein